MKKVLPKVEVVDKGPQGWGWACEYCRHEMVEDDPLADGDILICDKCGRWYQVV